MLCCVVSCCFEMKHALPEHGARALYSTAGAGVPHSIRKAGEQELDKNGHLRLSSADDSDNCSKQLTRLVIAADLCCKAEFSDGSVLVLDGSGMCAVLVDPSETDVSTHDYDCHEAFERNSRMIEGDHRSKSLGPVRRMMMEKTGPIRRFMSAFALKRHQGKLAAALAVRNAVAEPICICPSFVKSNGGIAFTSCERIRLVHWPENATRGLIDKRIEVNEFNTKSNNDDNDRMETDCVSDSGSNCSGSMSVGEGDGSVIIKAYGDVAYLILTGDGLRFLVRFPVEVKEDVVARCATENGMTSSDDMSSSMASLDFNMKVGVGGFHYMWIVQSYSTSSYPSRWKPAVELAMQVLAKWKSNNVESLMSDVDVKQRMSKLPKPNKAYGSGRVPGDEWWRLTSTTFYPPNCKLWLEWRPEACMSYIEDSNEVEVVIAADGSVLRSDQSGKFFRHYRRCPDNKSFEERIISATAVPPTANTFAGSYHIESIVRRSCIFFNAASSSITTPIEGKSKNSKNVVDSFASTKIVAKQTVDGVGSFTLYEYGRVHVKFADRTILNLFDEEASETDKTPSIPSLTSLCDVILPHGDRVKVRPANPIGVEKYVTAALQFLKWANQTEEEREGYVFMQQAINAEIERNKRTCAIVGKSVVDRFQSIDTTD